jgi:Tfp pilus assembly protein PilW
MNTSPHSRNAGFTLIELLLYIALSSILLGVISSLLIGLVQLRNKNQAIAEVEQQGLMAASAIGQAIRNATAINSPTPNASATSLSINTPAPSLSPTLFDLNAGALRVKEGLAAAVPLTSSRVMVTGLSFQNTAPPNTPGSVRFQYTVGSANTGNRNDFRFSKTFSGSASLRP